MKNIIDMVSSIIGATFAGLTTTTPVRLTGGKSNPLLGRVKKRSTQTVLLFGKPGAYDRKVKRHMEAEGIAETFTVAARTWGLRRPDMPVIDHTKNGEQLLYLEYIAVKAPTSVEYLLDGVVVDKASITGLPDPRPADQGGQKKKVIFRNVDFHNINSLRLNHEEFTG